MTDGDNNRSLILRLLQDLCSASEELPDIYSLSDVSVNWKRIIGKGGEAVVRLGVWEGRNVVVREVTVQGHRGWNSRSGQDTLKVTLYRNLFLTRILTGLS